MNAAQHVIEHREPRLATPDEAAAASEGFCNDCRAPLTPSPPDETHIVHLSQRRYRCTIGTCRECGRSYVLTWERMEAGSWCRS